MPRSNKSIQRSYKAGGGWYDLHDHAGPTLMTDKDSGSDYIISGDDVERLQKIVEHLQTDWPEMADTIREVITNLVEV
jgi:hypothetical protein